MLIFRADFTGDLKHLAKKCLIAKFYRVRSGRNRWGNYKFDEHPECYSLNFGEAARKIESLRESGKYWRVDEIPLLAYVGDRLALIITEIDSSAVPTCHGYSDDCGPYLDQIVSRFACGRERFLGYITDEFSNIEPANNFL